MAPAQWVWTSGATFSSNSFPDRLGRDICSHACSCRPSSLCRLRAGRHPRLSTHPPFEESKVLALMYSVLPNKPPNVRALFFQEAYTNCILSTTHIALPSPHSQRPTSTCIMKITDFGLVSELRVGYNVRLLTLTPTSESPYLQTSSPVKPLRIIWPTPNASTLSLLVPVDRLVRYLLVPAPVCLSYPRDRVVLSRIQCSAV
ncbi:hypothetical protein OF83DRAFT_76826 [Amylostereum chailletii]|nr:hypothetical protein OF83DRAFT_76826 [Amylostereum chailletii]